MKVHDIRRYFRWNLFQVYEPYPMPLFIRKRLKADQLIVINPGIFPVIDTPGSYIVEF